MKHLFAATLATLVIAGCGGNDEEPVQVVAANASLAVNAVVASSAVNTPFSFATGVPALGTTGATTLTFTTAAAAPAFTVVADGGTASGTTTFGSCVFTVTSSTFPAGHPLALGSTVTVNPCNLSVNTTGAVANGVPTSRNVALLLGAAASAGMSATVAVNAGGQLTLNGNNVGVVTLTPRTGTGG